MMGGGGGPGATVICTELHTQGLLSDEEYLIDRAYGMLVERDDPLAHAGYIRWAMPVVRKMQSSPRFSRFVLKCMGPWLRHMKYAMGTGPRSYVGDILVAGGKAISRFIALASRYSDSLSNYTHHNR